MPSASDNTFNPSFDRFKHLEVVPSMLWRRAAVVAPSDTLDLPFVGVLYVGTGGHVHVLTQTGDEVTFKNVPSGTVLGTPGILVYRVFLAGTTATDIIALG